MTVEQLFIVGSFAAGVGTALNGVLLARQPRDMPRSSCAYMVLELTWAAVSLALMVGGLLPTAEWLAYLFVLYIPLSLVVGFITSSRADDQHREARASKPYAYFTVLFGAAVALAALVAIFRA